MADPYREPEHGYRCPACGEALREFQGRLVCDACEGMFLSLDDLGLAIQEMTSVLPVFELDHEAPGKRACPRCRAQMTTLKLRLILEDETFKPTPELDRCAVHGLWFDGKELAKVFEKVASKGYGGGVGRTDHSRRPPKQFGWSAVFKKFGGRGGW